MYVYVYICIYIYMYIQHMFFVNLPPDESYQVKLNDFQFATHVSTQDDDIS